MLKEYTDLITSYRATPDTLKALVTNLTGEQARQRGHGEEEWSIGEVVAHLYDAEFRWFERVRRMREEDDPWLPLYPNANYMEPTLEESVEKFTALRAEHVTYLERIAAKDWERTGRLKTWGPVSIAWATRHLAAHDADHLAQIGRRILSLRVGRRLSSTAS